MGATLDLGGEWRLAVADESLRRAYPDPGFDDAAWATATVPGHWRTVEGFGRVDGPVLYRRAFEWGTSTAGQDPAAGGGAPGGTRWWLVLDGVFYQSDVWLDGTYLGDTEGYFFPHAFEVTEALAARREHVLAAEVACAPQRDRTAKRNLTGVFQHWDCLDPEWNPGGIWRPVRIEQSGPVRIVRARLSCAEATPERAVVAFRAILDSTESRQVSVRTRIAGAEHVAEHRLAAGENRVEWRVAVERPPLWWPHALGQPALVDATVDVHLVSDGVSDGVGANGVGANEDGRASDTRTVRTGIRQVRVRNWVASVNGERLFLKGTNAGPTRMALADATPADLERDVALAREAGLDLLRVHAHVSRPELYDAADRHGMLVWQDMPLQWGYARGTRGQAARQARELVDSLGHHPCIAVWCAHNEPFALDVEPGGDIDIRRLARRGAAAAVLPTWNKTILDGAVARALTKADGSRPVITHSGVPPQGDSHLYFGWYHGRERDLPAVAATWPRLVRFVSEFGAQAVPAGDAFMEPARWPALDWDRLGRRHGLQRQFFARNGLDPDDFATFDDWRAATQAHQADVIRFTVETLRRLKYRPAGGFAQFCLADAWPAVTWSVLDADRTPKAGYGALRAACAPVIVVADRPEAEYRTGEPIALDVHVVSDLREAIDDGLVAADLTWRGGSRRWEWGGAVPADACVRVGTVEAVTPETSGPMSLALTFEGGGRRVEARYDTRIVPR